MKNLVSATKLVFCLKNHMKVSLNWILHVLSFISIQATELLHKSFCRTWKKPFPMLVLLAVVLIFHSRCSRVRKACPEGRPWKPWKEGSEKRARNIRKAFALVEMDEWSCVALCIDGTRLKGMQIMNCGPMVLGLIGFVCSRANWLSEKKNKKLRWSVVNCGGPQKIVIFVSLFCVKSYIRTTWKNYQSPAKF